MASSARIDELRKKFDENPRRYFAPLANEYRKVGDLEQAIFICQEYLPQQPGHMSGHIVYGQALFESGRHEEARAVFETALSLDPENLIALRHLGDIARAAGDSTAARSWYQRVLEADPRNEEIGAVLKELGEAPSVPTDAAAPPAAEAIEPWARAESMSGQTPPPAEVAQADAPTLEIEQTPDSAQWGMIEPAPTPEPASESASEPASELASEPEGNLVEGRVAESRGEPEAPAGDELLDIADFDIGGSPQPSHASGEAHSTPESSQTESSQPESSQAAEPSVEAELIDDAALAFEADPYAIAAKPFDEEAPEPPPEPPEPPSAADHTEAPEGGLLDEALDTELPRPVEAAQPTETPPASRELRETPSAPTGMFVTETMAQLYLQQGHLEAAVDTYRRLVANRPDDAELRSRMEDAERQLQGPVPTLVPSEELPEPVAAEPATAPSEAGPTIREFLAGLFAGVTSAPAIEPTPESATAPEPATAVEPANAAEPATTPSATVSGSLDALFAGRQPSPFDERAATALARAFAPDPPEILPLQGMPARRASDELSLGHVFKSRTPARGMASDFSFDQFFADEMNQAPTATSEAPAAAPSANDDVAQFSAWLNGLKKT